MPAENKDIQALIDALDGTRDALEHGEALYKGLTRTIRNMRITLWVAVGGLILDLSLSVAFGFLFNNQNNINSQVQSNQSQVHKIECDLNDLFIQADTPQARDASPNKPQYDAAFHVIYLNRVQLGCQPPIAEPVRPPA